MSMNVGDLLRKIDLKKKQNLFKNCVTLVNLKFDIFFAKNFSFSN